MLSQRQQRLNKLFRVEISDLIFRHLKDPRLGMITVSEVRVSPDLANATAYVVLSGDEEARSRSLEGLASAAGYIRVELGKRLKLRRIPEIEFRRDTALERGDKILDLLDEVRKEERADE